jgi:polysaccharide pyruvyl transferase WcaK-like protein
MLVEQAVRTIEATALSLARVQPQPRSQPKAIAYIERVVGAIRGLRHKNNMTESPGSMLQHLSRQVGKLWRQVILVVHECFNLLAAARSIAKHFTHPCQARPPYVLTPRFQKAC